MRARDLHGGRLAAHPERRDMKKILCAGWLGLVLLAPVQALQVTDDRGVTDAQQRVATNRKCARTTRPRDGSARRL